MNLKEFNHVSECCGNQMNLTVETDDKGNLFLDYSELCSGCLNTATFTDVLYPRKCDITGEGMTEGYCIQDGLMYIKKESDMLLHVKETGYNTIDEAFEDDYYYWTEWDELDEDVNYTIDGTEVGQ